MNKVPMIYRRWTVFGFAVCGFFLCVLNATKPYLHEDSAGYALNTILSILVVGIWSFLFYDMTRSLIKVAGMAEDGLDTMIKLHDIGQRQVDIINQHKLGMLSDEEAEKAMHECFCAFTDVEKREERKRLK